MSKIKNDGLAEPFEQQQFGTAGLKGLKFVVCSYYHWQFCLGGTNWALSPSSVTPPRKWCWNLTSQNLTTCCLGVTGGGGSVGEWLLGALYCNIVIPTPLPSARQHPNYGDCLEVKREYYQNSSVLDCVTQCSQSVAHLYEQFLLVKQIGFVRLGPLRRA